MGTVAPTPSYAATYYLNVDGSGGSQTCTSNPTGCGTVGVTTAGGALQLPLVWPPVGLSTLAITIPSLLISPRAARLSAAPNQGSLHCLRLLYKLPAAPSKILASLPVPATPSTTRLIALEVGKGRTAAIPRVPSATSVPHVLCSRCFRCNRARQRSPEYLHRNRYLLPDLRSAWVNWSCWCISHIYISHSCTNSTCACAVRHWRRTTWFSGSTPQESDGGRHGIVTPYRKADVGKAVPLGLPSFARRQKGRRVA